MQTDDSFREECSYTYQLVSDGTSVSDAECEAALRTCRRPVLEVRGLAWQGVSAFFHVMFLLAASVFMAPTTLADDSMPDRDQAAFISQMLSAAQAERETDASTVEVHRDGDDRAGPSEAVGTQGSGVSSTNARARADAQGSTGLSTRAEALDDAAGFGMVGVLAQLGNAPSSPWGSPLEDAGPSSGLWSHGLNDITGTGGLELTGVGESGGPGTGLGIGTIRTVGLDGDRGFGPRRRLGARGHDAAAPARMRAGTPAVGGRLPSDLVQRTVRQSFGRFRACYEAGLRGNPTLSGRVSVRFVIGRDGAVMSAMNGGSDLPDSGVVFCVVNAFRGLSFPAPPDGIVTVSYPIVFTSQ